MTGINLPKGKVYINGKEFSEIENFTDTLKALDTSKYNIIRGVNIANGSFTGTITLSREIIKLFGLKITLTGWRTLLHKTHYQNYVKFRPLKKRDRRKE